MKKVLLWIVGILAALMIAVACIWGGELATIRSIHSVGGNEYLYQMEYKASYDLDDLISKDIDENAKLLDYVIGRIGKGLPLKIKSAQVADANGDCAVVEFDRYDGWKTLIVRKAEGKNHMLVTNHLLSEKYYTTEPNPLFGNPHSKSWWRYETAGAYLEEHDGTLSLDEAQECLSLVHWKDLVWENGTVEDTQFSNVYDQKGIALYLRNWNDFETTHRFGL